MIAEDVQLRTNMTADIKRSSHSIAYLAERVGVTAGSLEAALSGRRDFRVGEVIRLARALGQRAADWFEPEPEPILVDLGKLAEAADAVDAIGSRLREVR
jgi:transcriptional regulator with XRE-family HTH domain